MIDALATAPQTGSGFAEVSHKTIAFKTGLGELDAFRQSILRSGSESHTDRSLLFIGNRVSIFHRRSNRTSKPLQLKKLSPRLRASARSVLTGRRLGVRFPREEFLPRNTRKRPSGDTGGGQGSENFARFGHVSVVFSPHILELAGLQDFTSERSEVKSPIRGERLMYGIYLVSAHQRLDFAGGADFAPPRRGTRLHLAPYAASSGTSTRSNDDTPSGASAK